MYDATGTSGRYLNYVPVSERPDEEVQLTPITRLKTIPRHVRDENDAYEVICRMEEESRDNPVTSAAGVYNVINQIEEARHNIWYNAIIRNLSPEWKTPGMEIRFITFCKLVLDLDVPPVEGLRGTPDIMLYTEDKKNIFIGDVSVSKTVTKMDRHKIKKYDDMIKFLHKSRPGIRVQHSNFIVAEDLSNIDSLINEFKTCHRVLDRKYDPEYDKKVSESATYLSRLILDGCEEMQEYNKLNENKRIERLVVDSKLLESLTDVELQEYELDQYIPKRTERDIINMVKDEVDRLGGSSYYDSNQEEINKAFESVLDDNEYTLVKDDQGNLIKRKKPVMQPKSTLMVCDNSSEFTHLTDHKLINDFVIDIAKSPESDIRDYILSLLPTTPQLIAMEKIKKDKISKKSFSKHQDILKAQVGGPYQYKRGRGKINNITNKFEEHIVQGSKKSGRRNEKEEVNKLDRDEMPSYITFIDNAIEYYGKTSSKPPITDDSWDAANEMEAKHSKEDKDIYTYVKSTNGAQVANSMSALFNRISHLSASLGSYDNVFVPPNGSFIAIMPKNHAPVTSSNCDMPFIFITRSKRSNMLYHVDCEYKYPTEDYIYYVSKLCRLNTRIISSWDNAGYRLTATASYLLSRAPNLREVRDKVVGVLTFMTLDVHQKVSEYMDLLKYVGFMPFSALNKLPLLIKDKCNLIMKTKMDVWLFFRLKNFIQELSDESKLNASKPRLMTYNGVPTKESLGINLELPSFCDLKIRHANPDEYIEEMAVLNTVRPKHLHGSQFIDASTHKTAEWNLNYDEEVNKYKGWATDGHDEEPFPFESMFCFSSDAIHYATLELEKHVTETSNAVLNKIVKGPYCGFMHDNCSLRGCTKEVSDRLNQKDIHTTSVTSCFQRYEKDGFDDDKARALTIGQAFIKSKQVMEFSMSEKDQRGAGRPIATPTLTAKAALMLAEKPEAELGRYIPNNILVAGKDKLKEQHIAYTKALAVGVRSGLKKVFQLTEDQSKFSENDNTKKYKAYLQTNKMIPLSIRKVQSQVLDMLPHRIHLVKRLPESIKSDKALMSEAVTDETHLGVKGRIGWPQGMLNNMSTSVHCAADYWITKAFKAAYPSKRIETVGLVHSDDSWVTVCCNDIETFKLFSVFRSVAKRLFCLKLNIKKLWGGKYLGELVSHYNLNGHVHMSTGKVICNGLSNLTYQNWAIDVSNQISTLQQAFRAGATIGNLIMLSTLLRQQMMNAYQVSGIQKRLIHKLPIEMGGYPIPSVFRMAVTGVHAHYSDLHKMMTTSGLDEAENIDRVHAMKLIQAAVSLSMSGENPITTATYLEGLKDDDYLSIELPTKGEVFKSIKHIMPRSKKMALAIEVINRVVNRPEFASDGLALIVPRPATLAESIGHYGETAKSRQFELSAERYTQSTRKLAISQSLQSAGKVVRVNGSRPMTFEEMYEALIRTQLKPKDAETTLLALSSENEVVIACDSIINTSTLEATDKSKGKVINRMPQIESVYSTISPLQDVLLTLIDSRCDTNFYKKYGTFQTSLETRLSDARDILNRFKSYFSYFDTKVACKLIMQGKLSTVRERTWIQPKVSADTIPNFLEDLYGSTIDSRVVYRVRSDRSYMEKNKVDRETINDIYTTLVMNCVYEGKIKIESYGGRSVVDAIKSVDHSKLDYNTKLKHAVCQLEFLNNPEYLDKVVCTEKFAYEWRHTQQRTPDGKYYGDWSVDFIYSDIICRAESFLGRITLTVNKNNKDNLLRGMRLMTQRCFSKYAYEYDTAWWTSSLWGSSKGNNPDAHFRLCWYNPYDTQIKQGESISTSIDIYIDELLNIKDISSFDKPKGYEFEDNYRVIKAIITDSNFKESGFRVANIYQDLSFKNAEKIRLHHSHIEHYLNETLLKHKVLEDLMLNRPLTLSNKDAYELLNTCTKLPQKQVLWKFMYYLAELVKSRPGDQRLVLEEESNEVSHSIIDVVATSFEQSYKVSMNTEVESLDAVAAEYQTSLIKGSKRIFKPENITRDLCKHIFKGYRHESEYDYLFSLLIDPNLKRWFDSYSWDMFILLKESEKTFDYIPYRRELFYFIYAYEMDKEAFWSRILRSKLLPRNRNHDNIINLAKFTEETVEIMNLTFFASDWLVETRTLLDDYLDN